MIQDYLNKTYTEMSSNLDKQSRLSKPKNNPLIYNNYRNSTGMNFKKKKVSRETQFITEFVNNDSRSPSVPFDATKSSENIQHAKIRGFEDRKRASTTDKFGPRPKKMLPKIQDTNNS